MNPNARLLVVYTMIKYMSLEAILEKVRLPIKLNVLMNLQINGIIWI